MSGCADRQGDGMMVMPSGYIGVDEMLRVQADQIREEGQRLKHEGQETLRRANAMLLRASELEASAGLLALA